MKEKLHFVTFLVPGKAMDQLKHTSNPRNSSSFHNHRNALIFFRPPKSCRSPPRVPGQVWPRPSTMPDDAAGALDSLRAVFAASLVQALEKDVQHYGTDYPPGAAPVPAASRFTVLMSVPVSNVPCLCWPRS